MKSKKSPVAILLFVIWLSISLTYKPDHPVTEEEILRYGETYLSTYKNLVNQFKSKDRIYFLDYVEFFNRTVELRPKISHSRGAAIEFVLNTSSSKFQSSRSNERIEVAVFGGDFYTEYRPQGPPFKIIGRRVVFRSGSGAGFMAEEQCVFEVFNNATLAIIGNNWTIGSFQHFNPVTVKGSNMSYSWNVNASIWDVEFDFRYDLVGALNASEGVREYVAYNELKDLLYEIAKKSKEDPNYGWPQYEADLEELDRIAREEYGINRTDFLEEVLDFVKEKVTLSKKLPLLSIEYSNNFVYTLFFAVLLDTSLFVAMRISRILKRVKRYSGRLAKIFEQILEWFTFIFVLTWYFMLVPFGYEWTIHVPILVLQLVVLMVTAYFLGKWRSKLQFDRKSILYRLAFAVIFLSIFLVVAQSALYIVYSIPFMFKTYSLIIGEATTLSFLVATIAVLVILISQWIYDSFQEHLSRQRAR